MAVVSVEAGCVSRLRVRARWYHSRLSSCNRDRRCRLRCARAIRARHNGLRPRGLHEKAGMVESGNEGRKAHGDREGGEGKARPQLEEGPAKGRRFSPPLYLILELSRFREKE